MSFRRQRERRDLKDFTRLRTCRKSNQARLKSLGLPAVPTCLQLLFSTTARGFSPKLSKMSSSPSPRPTHSGWLQCPLIRLYLFLPHVSFFDFKAAFWKMWEPALSFELLKWVSICTFWSRIHFSTLPSDRIKDILQPSVTCVSILFMLALSLSSPFSLSLDIIHGAVSQGGLEKLIHIRCVDTAAFSLIYVWVQD